jgi:nicotinate dehydrogenase subunit B
MHTPQAGIFALRASSHAHPETPLRTGNLRGPNGPQVTFALESCVDELAAAAKADPIQFRLDTLEEDKEDDVFRRRQHQETKCSRGAASPTHIAANTVVAVIAEVEVNRETGRVWYARTTAGS